MKVDKSEILEACRQAKKDGFDYLVKITAVDYSDHIDVIYFVRDMEKNADAVIEATLDSVNPSVPSVMEVYKAADWYERELSEMFGIEIEGRKTRRLLLEKWEGSKPPLRKSFVWGKD
ncbi:MAG: NADH-quinone oxidoreductase subunit C [Candidatus Micrarchaeia archaeon]